MSAPSVDAEVLQAWWVSLLADEPPSADTRGRWFGLFETGEGATLYVHGFPSFDAADASAEWATGTPSWAPAGRYVELPSLVSASSWRQALEDALRLVEELQPQQTWPGVLEGVAAGFDDGDAHVVWVRDD